MATLNENIEKVKHCFGNIKGHVNTKYNEYAEKEERIESGTPVENYGGEISDVIDEIYSLGYDNGKLDVDDSGYDEGFEAGKQSVIANSKYTPKTATGKVISLNDVSEVYHKVKVYGDGQEVEVYGKNLYDNSRLMTKTDDGTVASRVQSGYLIPVAHNTNYIISATNVTTQPFYSIKGWTKENYIATPSWNDLWSLGDVIKNNHQGSFDTGDYDYISFRTWAENSSYGVTEDTLFQVELGTPTPYEPYTHQTITATPVGTEIESLCPNMNFFADEDITVDYYSSFGMAEKELAMWNAFTNFGNRTTYTYAFAYVNFEGYAVPEGLIKNPKRINSMFQAYEGRELPKGVDLSTFVPDGGYAAYCATSLFNTSTKIEKIYDLKIPETNLSYTQAYYGCKNLKEIEMHRSGENTVYDTKTFQGCTSLTHVIFSGVIASDINLQWSPLLDDESIKSLAQTLKWYDGLEDEYMTKTITLHPDVWARAAQINIFDSDETFVSIVEYIDGKGWKRA